MDISNKTINYSIYVRENGKPIKIADTTELKLPSIEILTDTIKGSGIIGEVDWPTFYQPGAMSLEVSVRASNDDIGVLMAARDIEIRWVTDVFDTTSVSTKVNAHKAFIKCVPKKIEEGKIAMGEGSEGSFEYEVFAYKRTLNGKELLNIDKFNSIFAINGKNLVHDLQAFL